MLFSNAPSGGGDRFIVYSRISILVSIGCLILAISSSYLDFYSKGIGVFSGLLQSTAVSHIFHAFVVVITATILVLNAFYPRKVITEYYSSI